MNEVKETKLWHLYVDFLTDKIFDRIFIGYIVADTYDEAFDKMISWKNVSPMKFVTDMSYTNRTYKDNPINPKKVKKANFHCSPLYDEIERPAITNKDIILV